MSKLTSLLQKIHYSVPFSEMKKSKQYSVGLYTGGIKISTLHKADKNIRELALSREWYVRYSHRNPTTNKMERQINIKFGVNIYKTKNERLEVLKTIERNLLILLKAGFNPYHDTAQIIDMSKMTVKLAIDHALNIKKAVLTATSYRNYAGRITRFRQWLYTLGFENMYISEVSQQIIQTYLNEVLQNSSAANHNNTRLDLSSLFATLKSQKIVSENYVKNIDVLKSTPQRNKSYTATQQEDIFEYMEKHDPLLLLFVQFVSYNFFRNVEVCRLQVQDIDKSGKTVRQLVKDGTVKIKIIPDILLEKIPDLSEYKPTDYLFTPNGIGEWNTNEVDKRGYFGKRFRKVKEHFKLSNDYTVYSFRHTFATRLFNELIKKKTPDEAESYLMLITGHKTKEALRKYLRTIDAYRPDDYSDMLR